MADHSPALAKLSPTLVKLIDEISADPGRLGLDVVCAWIRSHAGHEELPEVLVVLLDTAVRTQAEVVLLAALATTLSASRKSVDTASRLDLLWSEISDRDLIDHLRGIAPERRDKILQAVPQQPAFTARADGYEPGEIPPDAQITPARTVGVQGHLTMPAGRTRVIVRGRDGVDHLRAYDSVPRVGDYLVPRLSDDPLNEPQGRVARVEHLGVETGPTTRVVIASD